MTLFGKRSIARGMAGENGVLDVGEFGTSQKRSVERDLVVHQSNGRAALYGATAVSLVVVLAGFFKSYLGIDFTDESLYSAIPYRFYLGDKPFIDEWNLTQLASLLVYPFFRVFWFLKGSTDGTLLFSRQLLFFFGALISFEMFVSLRRHVGTEWLVLALPLPIIFVPYNLYGPSYNALGAGLFAMGLWVGWDSRVRAERPLAAMSAGLYHGLAVFAYPTLGAAAVCFCIFALITARHRLKESLLYLLGAAIGPAIIMVTFGARVSDLVGVLNYVAVNGRTTGHHWGLYKFAKVFGHFWVSVRYKPVLFTMFVLLAGTHFRAMKSWRAVCVVVVLILFFFSTRSRVGGDGLMGFVRCLAFAAPLFFALLPSNPTHRLLMGGVWMPAVCAGIAMAWSSNMSGTAAGVPVMPAAIISAYFAGLLTTDLFRQPLWRSYAGWVPAVLLVSLVLYGRLSNYMEDDNASLTVQIKTGPFSGLYTTPLKADYLARITADISRVRGASTSILFQPHFPAGYLLTDLRPAAPSLWATCPNEAAVLCHDFYLSRSGPRGLVVNLHKLPYYSSRIDDFQLPKDNPMETMLHARHRQLVATDSYVIYQATPAQE